MKYFVKFLVVTFFFLQCTYALAEQKIVYLDMTFVLNKSKAGEGAQIFLKKTFEENQKKFIIQENERVIKAYKSITANDFESLGKLFYASHSGLQHQFKVSCDELDFLVDATKENKNIIKYYGRII